MKALLAALFCFSFIGLDATAQNLGTPHPPRLCDGTWQLQRIQSASGVERQSPAAEFRLILSPDGRMQQGLYPEGLVQSTWRFDPVRMTLYVHDVGYDNTYTLRVLSARRDALTLEMRDLGERTLMYYALTP